MRLANEVYSRSGLVIRDFLEAEGELQQFYMHLETALPALLELYDEVYLALPESDPQYPWATGKRGEDARRKGGFSPIFARPCDSKVFHAFVWPIFAALRTLIYQPDPNGALFFKMDPFVLFQEKRQELIESVKSFHKNQAHGIVQQVGKDKELWIRLETALDLELKMRERLGTLSKPIPIKPKASAGSSPAIVDLTDFDEPTVDEGYTNRRPRNCTFLGQPVSCSSWKDIYTGLAAILAHRHPEFETKSQQLRGTARPYFSKFRNGIRVVLSANRRHQYIHGNYI